MPKKHRTPPFLPINSEERVKEILDYWKGGSRIKATPCEVCGHMMIGRAHQACLEGR